MSLQALLGEVDARWYGEEGAALDATLAGRARASALGRRLLASWLAEGPAAALLAPAPGRDPAALARRWTRARVGALCRDLGVLAFAPMIRAEVRREPVRRLRAALGNSYLLALDRTVWEGRLASGLQEAAAPRFAGALKAALAAGDDAPLYALFDAQGRAELEAWARRREPALADWCALLHAPADAAAAWLPEKPVLRVYTHHEARAPAARGPA